MDYYNEIKKKIINNEIYGKVKDYAKERNRVTTYFEIGRLLTEAGNKYGEDIIGKYSEKLMHEVGKKYTKSTLFRMKQFYNIFNDKNVAPLAQQLSWSHYVELLSLNDNNKIIYYINQCIIFNLSRNELRLKIKSKEYERLDNNSKNKLILNKENTIDDFIKHPIIIKNKYNYTDISERILKQLILEDISSFMKELGEGYSFIDSEYKIKLGDRYNYIDLLLFNIKFNCYVVVELKVTELKKEHEGQIRLYMNYIDENVKSIYHDKTIGIIIARYNNQYVVRYCSDSRIFNTTFELI